MLVDGCRPYLGRPKISYTFKVYEAVFYGFIAVFSHCNATGDMGPAVGGKVLKSGSLQPRFIFLT